MRKSIMLLVLLGVIVAFSGTVNAGVGNGLVAYWSFDDNADDVIGGNDGTLMGNASYVSGKLGKAVSTSSVGSEQDYVVFDTTSDGLTGAWTAAAWINVHGQNIGAFIDGYFGDEADDDCYGLRLPGQYGAPTNPGMSVYTINTNVEWGGVESQTQAYTPPLNTWALMVFVGSDTQCELFADGVSKGTIIYTEISPEMQFKLTWDRLGSIVKYPGYSDPEADFDELAIWDRNLTYEEIQDLWNSGEGTQLFLPSVLSPGNGDTIKPANPLTLSWENIPNDSNPVYVDVWWGTEPNELHPGYEMTLIVDAEENTAAVTVDSSAVDTYYWRVNSYLNGAAHINEPNMAKGALWSYNTVADAAPTVEIVTLDQMTWSGEGTPIDSTVTDDAISAVTIEWSADLPDGISAAYNPGNDVADTTVTLTKDVYSAASIANAGFEDDVLPDGGYIAAAGWGWSETQYRQVTNPYPPGPIGVYPAFGGVAPEGSNVAQTGVGGIAQVLTETLAADTTYTLTVEVGNAAFTTGRLWDGYRVQLLAGGTPGIGEIAEGTLLAEDDSTLTVAPDTFVTVTVVFDSTAVDPDLLGEPLQIRLLSGTDPAAEPIYFDDVRLTADPGFILTGIQTVTMTVIVGDEANPAADTDSIEIDVYDDACHLAQVGQGKSAETDFNGDCITGLEDLAVAAAAWLDDYSVTGPEDK